MQPFIPSKRHHQDHMILKVGASCVVVVMVRGCARMQLIRDVGPVLMYVATCMYGVAILVLG